MTLLEECESAVVESLLAWRLCVPEGAVFTGERLLRWRQLPEKERAYYAALLAPYEDPHWQTRVSTVHDRGNGRCEVIYEPPCPQPCACKRPVFVRHDSRTARCSRCLQAWPWQRYLDEESAPVQLREPLVVTGSVDRPDMGYAIERVLKL